jgi:hypothetical protein
MKTAAILRRKLAADKPVFGLWVTLGRRVRRWRSPDDWSSSTGTRPSRSRKSSISRATATARYAVRIAELNGGLIKRALDIGADGIVVPWVETVEQPSRQWRLLATRRGPRGIGGRATCWGSAWSLPPRNERMSSLCPSLTVRAAKQVAALVQDEGVELFCFGPAVLFDCRFRGQWEGRESPRKSSGKTSSGRRENCGLLATSMTSSAAEAGFRVMA